MRSFRSKPVGWRGESHRHYLAAKGISTKVKVQNRALLKKWDMPAGAHVYVDESSGKVVAAYDETSGVGGAISKKMLDVANKRGIMEVGKGKYFLLKEDVPEVEARLKLLGTVRRGLQDVDADVTRVDVDALKAERALAGAAVVGSGAVTPKAHVEFTGSQGAEVAYVPFEDLGPGWASKEDALLDALRVTKPGEVAKIESGRLMPVWEQASEWQPGDTITTGIGRFDEEATSRSLGSGVSIGGSHPGSMASMTPKGEFVPQIPVRGVAEFGKAKLVGAAQGAGVIGGAAAVGQAAMGHRKKYREDREADEGKEWMKAREGAAGAESEVRFEKEFGSRRTVKGPEDRKWMGKMEADE